METDDRLEALEQETPEAAARRFARRVVELEGELARRRAARWYRDPMTATLLIVLSVGALLGGCAGSLAGISLWILL